MVWRLAKGNEWTYEYTDSWSWTGTEWNDTVGTFKIAIVDQVNNDGIWEFKRVRIEDGETTYTVPITYDSTTGVYTYGTHTLNFTSDPPEALYNGVACTFPYSPGSHYYMDCLDIVNTTYWADQVFNRLSQRYHPETGLYESKYEYTLRGLFYWVNLERL